MAKSPSQTVFNWYEVLGCSVESSKEHIAKAARKAALKYHPDRNADPKAKELFLQIQNAKDFLLDDNKRKELDEYLISIKKRKEHEERRNQQMDGKRRKMKSQLEERVHLAKQPKRPTPGEAASSTSTVPDPSILKNLQKENAARMEATAREHFEKEEKRKRDLEYHKFLASLGKAGYRVKVKWRTKDESHSEESLYLLFKMFGSIEEVHLIPGKGNQAIVSFTREEEARAAVDAYATSDSMRVSPLMESDKKKAAVFTHDYGKDKDIGSSSSSKFGGHHDLGAAVRRVLEREALLRSLHTEEDGSDGLNSESKASEAFTEASNKPQKTSPEVDLKSKESDILMRMKLAAQKKQAERNSKIS